MLKDILEIIQGTELKAMKNTKRGLVIRRVKTKSGADAVAKQFGEDKEFRTRIVPNKKKDYTKPSWE